ncbi:MAG: hypothetical protein M3Q20_07375 [Actinomycetota bacterium]|nr:hypothetical protein [Actinomycetota bacterium]
MAELQPASPSVVVVLASIEACDRVSEEAGATAMRVAPRELMLVGDVEAAAVRRALAEPDAIIEDVSDGWAVFELLGDDAREAFARVCELELPAEGWVQGEVARAAAKVLVEPGRITILVPAMLGTHVEERIRADAAEVLTP